MERSINIIDVEQVSSDEIDEIEIRGNVPMIQIDDSDMDNEKQTNYQTTTLSDQNKEI